VRTTPRYAVALTAVALLAGGCAAGTDAAGQGDADHGVVTVLAAASLTEPLTELATAYEKNHPDVEVRTSFGSSTTLAQQVAQGAPADLYLSAGTTALDQIPADLRPPDRVTTVARNVLEIATPPDNPAGVAGLTDLARPDTDVVLCVSSAPCGQAADEVLARAGVTPHVVSRETDVKATLAKVRLGEVDAAVVYHSDVVSAGDDVHAVAVPDDANEVLTYPLLRLTDTAAVSAYADYLSSPTGLASLEKHGFLAP
jgi:molybdate transport system substrate-binding protein